MTAPGKRLHDSAARWCSSRTMERIVDPIVADIRTEHAAAVADDRVWMARWIVIAGYVGFAKAIVIHGSERAMDATYQWTASERRLFSRTLWMSIALTFVAAAVFMVPLLLQPFWRANPNSVWFLVPQAFPLAVPVGISLGVAFTGREAAGSRRFIATMVAASMACSLMCFAALEWVVPAANQMFRERVFAGPVPPLKGLAELTLGELRQFVDRGSLQGAMNSAPSDAAFMYHGRFALSGATFALTLFILSIAPHFSRRSVSGVFTVTALFGYYALLAGGRNLALAGELPAFVAAWVPNLALIAITIAMTSTRGGLTYRAAGGKPTTS